MTLTAADLGLCAPLEFRTSQERRETLRNYIATLGPKEIESLPFRDLKNDMAVWRRQFHAALAPVMHRARGKLFDELAKEECKLPDLDNKKRGVDRIRRTGKAVAAELRPPGFRTPPLAMAMMAEAVEELRDALRKRKREPEAIRSICQDAVRNLLVQNGFLSTLLAGHSGQAASFAFHVGIYVKAVFGMNSTSQGVAAAIVRNIEKNEREAATRFIAHTYTTLANAAPNVELHWPHEDMDGDSAAAKEHAQVKRKLFVDTWVTEGNSSLEFRTRGPAHLLLAEGRLEPWNSPVSVVNWLGMAPSETLPEAILHVAGAPLMRYLHEYLLGGERGKQLGLRPDAEFTPELALLLRREGEEFLLDVRAVADIEHEDAADSRKVHLEVRLQIRFRQPDLFQMHSALIVKADY